jgi:hypothetical protein
MDFPAHSSGIHDQSPTASRWPCTGRLRRSNRTLRPTHSTTTEARMFPAPNGHSQQVTTCCDCSICAAVRTVLERSHARESQRACSIMIVITIRMLRYFPRGKLEQFFNNHSAHDSYFLCFGLPTVSNLIRQFRFTVTKLIVEVHVFSGGDRFWKEKKWVPRGAFRCHPIPNRRVLTANTSHLRHPIRLPSFVNHTWTYHNALSISSPGTMLRKMSTSVGSSRLSASP